MRIGFAAPLLALALLAGAARADDRWLLVGGGGAFDTEMPSRSEDTAPAYEIEFRMKPGLWYVHPHVGFQGTTDGMVYGYAGIHLDFPIGDHFRIVPSESVGLYSNGDNHKDLGGLMEFKIGGGIAWRFDNDLRIGVTWYHMSNAGTGSSNPGAEMMFLEIGYPLW